MSGSLERAAASCKNKSIKMFEANIFILLISENARGFLRGIATAARGHDQAVSGTKYLTFFVIIT